MANRAWSKKLHHGVESIVLMHAPVGADECMLHAWAALAAANRGEKSEENMDYARGKLAAADHWLRNYPERKIRHRKLFDAELAELRDAMSS